MISSSAAEVAQRLADSLESAGIEYAIGGALALGVAGVPRGTLDVDLNVFVEAVEFGSVLRTLTSGGVTFESDAGSVAERDGTVMGRADGMRIDVFFPSIPFSLEARSTRVKVETPEGWSGWFLSAESIAVFKLLYYRAKDVVDLERLVAVRGGDFDHGYVRNWIVDMMGADDERVVRWDDLVRRFGP